MKNSFNILLSTMEQCLHQFPLLVFFTCRDYIYIVIKKPKINHIKQVSSLHAISFRKLLQYKARLYDTILTQSDNFWSDKKLKHISKSVCISLIRFAFLLYFVFLGYHFSKQQKYNVKPHLGSAHLPRRAITPHRAQIMRLIPTEPLLANTPLGEMNMPEPENRKTKQIELTHIELFHREIRYNNDSGHFRHNKKNKKHHDYTIT